MAFYAHTTPGPCSEWEEMSQHEEATARRCEAFLARIDPDWAAWGDLLGRWHDLGKYQAAFQRKLAGEKVHVPHAGVGAALACSRDARSGLPAAFAIGGHHAGLANLRSTEAARIPLVKLLEGNQTSLKDALEAAPSTLTSRAPPALPGFLASGLIRNNDPANRPVTFFTRMLFSALVDSDRLATAEFYARAEGRKPDTERLRYDDLTALCDRLDAHVDTLSRAARTDRPSAVNAMRADVLAACRSAAGEAPGLFALTVPTGGGKTLAAMSFALRHAIKHGLDRVIVVIPFTSIIEQNAAIYRAAFGVDGQPDERNVLEHHSGIDEERRFETNREAELRRRIAAENWDAPVIVTTTVQFFESLFSDHPSRCRKIHRIAGSVVILDEVQTLPPQFLLAMLDSLRELTAHYNCSIVLSTATPPALEARPDLPQGLTRIRPIMPQAEELFASPAARRVNVEWRTERVTPFSELADEIAELSEGQVLVIVHRRQDARTLYEMLPPEGRYHLSALMCPAHRLERIEEIRERLRSGAPCRLVSTQLIEAGVDVDFPVVYRALAGLDSLAQSAGRCDREGKLTEGAGRPGGRFVVFRAETPPPPGTLRKALNATELLLQLQTTAPELEGGLDLYNPEHGMLFFRELYRRESLDAAHVQRELASLNFANAAAAFRLIEDGYARPLVVPWDEGVARMAAFRRDPSRSHSRALQPYLVQVRRDHLQALERVGAVEWWEDHLALPTPLFGNRYSGEFGLDADPRFVPPDVLVA